MSNAIYFANATVIQGYKFNDLNDNGIMDANEPRLANQIVNFKSTFASGSITSVAITDANGRYEQTINVNEPSSFSVWSSIPSGWTQTTPVKGTGMRPYVTDVAANQPSLDVNIGIRDTSVPVPNTVPEIHSLWISASNVQVGTEVLFQGAFIDPDVGDSHTFFWDFGDGSTSSGTLNISHIYAVAGTYTVTLTITDSKGVSDTNSYGSLITVTPILVPNTAPKIDAVGYSASNVQVGTEVSFEGRFTDPDVGDNHTFLWDFGDGSNSSVGTSVSHAYATSGSYTVSFKVTDSKGLSDIRSYASLMTVTPKADCSVPTVTSNGAGGWTPRAPQYGDVALIKSGHTVTTSFIETTNLCIEPTGKLISTAGADLTIVASGVLINQGEIQGANGKDGDCPTGMNDASKYVHATPAKRVDIYADTFINDVAGKIYSGKGGDDSPGKCGIGDNTPGAWKYIFASPVPGLPEGQSRVQQSNWGTWTYQWNNGEIQYGFPSVGETAGEIGVEANIFTNKGTIQAGTGGYGNSSNTVHGTSIGGLGGSVKINSGDVLNAALTGKPVTSTNTGEIKAGCGGTADIPGCWSTGDIACNANTINPSRPGNGGDVSLVIGSQFGIIGSCGNGGTTSWDPTTLKADGNTRFEGSDHVEIYGPGDWVMELGKLSEGAVSANKTIVLAIGKGGVIDLRGITKKAFKAGEKIEIFSDHVLLDEGVTLNDIAEAPIIEIKPAKILYRVSMNGSNHIEGKAGAVLPVSVNLSNDGPVEDTYSLIVSNTEGWLVSSLPETVTVAGLKKQVLSFNITLPQFAGENIVSVLAKSNNDPTIQKVFSVRVTSKAENVAITNYNLKGIATDKSTGNPISGLAVKVGDKSTATNADGSFELTGLVNGNYTIIATKDGYDIPTKAFEIKGENISINLEAQPIVVGNYTAKGVLKDKLGNPLANVSVTVAGKTTTTDLTGSWSIGGLVEGKYNMSASSETFSCVRNGFEMGNDEYVQTVSCTPSTALKLNAKPHTWNTLYQGQEVTHSITVKNNGTQTATNVVVKNVLSTGNTLVSLKVNGDTCEMTTGVCNLPDLKPGESVLVELVAKAENATAGISNKITLTSNEYLPETQRIYNDVKPYLSSSTVCKPKPVAPQGTLNCQVTVELSPFAPEKIINDLSANIQAPKGTELVSISNLHGNCDTTAFPTLVCTIDELSNETAASVNRKTINYSVKITDGELLVFLNDSKVTAKGYPQSTNRDRTNLLVPQGPEVKADIIIAIDTTGSMRKFWNALKIAITQFIDAQIANKQSPTIALIDFKDDVTLRYFGSDMQALKKKIENLDISGGGLCPEASVEALDLAFRHIKQKGMIALITDAPPYPEIDVESLQESLIQRINEKEVNFIFPLDKLGCSIDQETFLNGIQDGLNR